MIDTHNAGRAMGSSSRPPTSGRDVLAELNEELALLGTISSTAGGPPLDFDVGGQEAVMEAMAEQLDEQMEAAQLQGGRARLRAQLDSRFLTPACAAPSTVHAPPPPSRSAASAW